MVTDRYCDNPGCCMNGMEVRTDKTECLSCGKELRYAKTGLKPSDFWNLTGWTGSGDC